MTKELQVKEAPSRLIELAIEKGNVDLDKLERVMKLQREYEADQARKSYHEAMSNFKANPPKINKDKKVSFGAGKTAYNHASLYNITEKISKELSKYGLSASWSTQQNGSIIVTCKITHVQGHSEQTSLAAQADTSGSKNSIQAIGSTITYLERYTLLALTGLATFDQDDDGNGASVEYIDENQLHAISVLISDKKVDTTKFCKAFGITEVSKLPKAKYNQAIAALQAKKVSK